MFLGTNVSGPPSFHSVWNQRVRRHFNYVQLVRVINLAKLTLTDITSGYSVASKLNENFEAIEEALENTLSRDGTSPNQMDATLDMNSKRIINVGAPSNPNDAARLQDVQDALSGDEPTAVFVSIADSGGFFSSTNVEGALQELGEDVSDIQTDLADGVTPSFDRTALEIGAGVTPTNTSVPFYPYVVTRTGAVGNGIANDFTALNNAINSGHKWIRIPAGTYLISTDSVINVPSGTTVEGDGPNTIIRKTSGAFTTDIFYTSGSNVTFRNFRMEGPVGNTAVDGIMTEAGSDILVENVEGYQVSTTVTIGLTTATDRATIRNVFSEGNAQQGVLFHKATNAYFDNLRAKNIGSSVLHHGVYVGDVQNLHGFGVDSEGCYGAGLNIFAQTGEDSKNITISGINCRNCGLSSTSVRGGVVVARDNTSTLFGVQLSDLNLYDNDEFNLYAENVDELIIENPYADGNSQDVNSGLYFGATFSGISCKYKVSGGYSKAHGSNVRINASSGCTINIEVDDIRLFDSPTGSNLGIFADGAGVVNLDVGAAVKFSNNAVNMTHSASGGTFSYKGISRGVATIADGGTIAHGHPKTPTGAVVTSGSASNFASVTGISSTQLTVALKTHDNSAGASQTVYWMAFG